jgi:hypothetical protein
MVVIAFETILSGSTSIEQVECRMSAITMELIAYEMLSTLAQLLGVLAK